MDKERAEILWQQCAGVFSYAFGDFGSHQRIRVLRFFPDPKMPFIEEFDEGHMTHAVAPEDLPEQFEPYVSAWQERQKQDSQSKAP